MWFKDIVHGMYTFVLSKVQVLWIYCPYLMSTLYCVYNVNTSFVHYAHIVYVRWWSMIMYALCGLWTYMTCMYNIKVDPALHETVEQTCLSLGSLARFLVQQPIETWRKQVSANGRSLLTGIIIQLIILPLTNHANDHWTLWTFVNDNW